MYLDTIPKSVARALRQLSGHGRVRAVGTPESTDGGVKVVIDFDSGLGNRWRALGQSENGVKAVEPLTFVFAENYPIQPPLIFLRDDFDRSHPHLLPVNDSLPPMPCYVVGHSRELLRMRGINGVADQLGIWLQKAAELDLMDPEQGWSFVRRDHFDDVLVADADALRSLAGEAEGSVFLKADAGRLETGLGEREYVVSTSSEGTTLQANVLAEMFRTREVPALAIAAWSGQRPDGSAFIADQYRPESVHNVQDLLVRADELGCGRALRPKLDLLWYLLDGKQYSKPLVVAIALLARRPFYLAGETSPIELCLYLIEVTKAADLVADSKHQVRLLGHRDVLTPKLLRQASGLEGQGHAPQWVLFGAGSLGSKIALHLARQAYGPVGIVDQSWMLPHNFARHGLVPLGARGIPWQPKANLLAESLLRLGAGCTVGHFDIVEVCMSRGQALQKEVWAGKSFILDTTGSPSVTEALCAPTVVDRPPAIRASLLAAGRVAYCGVEGPGNNPSLIDLQAESYRLMAQEPGMIETVFSISGQSVMLGQGCASITSPMTDAFLSASAAPIAARIANTAEEGMPAVGEILLGSIAEDCLGQTWRKETVPPFTAIQSEGMPAVRISSRVVKMMDEDISRWPGLETGGVVVGRFSEVANAFTIVDLIAAPSDSTRKPNEFKLGVNGLNEAISQLVSVGAGTIYPLGTWHNHLGDTGPSVTDLGTGALLAVGQSFPALLLIRTPTGFRTVFAEAIDQQLAKSA